MTLIVVITSSYSHQRAVEMPRYLVERTFPDHLEMPTNAEGTNACRVISANNSEDQVTWVHSHVTEDKGTTFCI
jgi:hypothetical protein